MQFLIIQRKIIENSFILINGNALKRIPNPEPQTKNLYTASALHHKQPAVSKATHGSFSKAYGLASIRCGYLVADKECIALINRIRPPFNVNSAAQIVCAEAVKDQEHIKKVVALISGGNIDVLTISSMINKGLISRGRIFTFSVQLPDIPGQLEKVSRILNECNANVIGVEHNQFKNFARFSEVELRVTCETNGESHIKSIIERFNETGYQITRIN